MKSIVLCESTLVEQSDHGKELKEAKEKESGNRKVPKKLTNGNSGDESLAEAEILSAEENSLGKTISKGSAQRKTCENEETNVVSAEGLKNSSEIEDEEEGEREADPANSPTGDGANRTKKSDAASHNEVSCSEIDGHSEDLLKRVNGRKSRGKRKPSSEGCSKKEDGDARRKTEVSVLQKRPKEDGDARRKTEASVLQKRPKEDSLSDVDGGSGSTSSVFKECVAEKSNGIIEGEGREQLMEEIILDEDENKENEKERKRDFEGSREDEGEELSNGQSSGCEIQVSECQTISDKNSMWNEKSEQDLEENTSSSTQEKSDGEEYHSNGTNDKEVEILKSEEERQEEEEEEEEEDMQIVSDEHMNGDVKSEDGEAERMDLEGPYPNQTLKRSKSEEDRWSDSQLEFIGSRKRKPCTKTEGNSRVKKRRLSVDCKGRDGEGDEEDKEEGEATVGSSDMKPKDENVEVSSRPESPASRDTTTVSSSKDQSNCEKVSSTETTSVNAKKAEKSKTSKDSEEGEGPKTQPEDKEALTSSFLASLRGTLKGLTRSDLEELIVQKLCEAITERSNVGELRRKAQALEQDQERWKEKVQSLTKLVREMEMVMKKYMAEVQKQRMEGDSQMVIPLKVTRSVGLQVSFLSSANKTPKPTASQPATSSPVQNVNGRNVKPVPSKIPTQLNIYPKSVWNKPVAQKASPTPKSLVNHQKKTTMPRSDFGVMHQNRPSLPQSLLHNNRGMPSQVPGMRQNAKSVSATQTPQLQKPQQQGNSSSKVIDLTDDDDRQTGSVGKTGPIRVVNHLSQQSQPVTQNNRYAYILPASTASPTGSSAGGQSRQVLIATPTMPQPNRQLMCSMPPLLFKGGNVVQQQGPQSQVIQSNRIVYPKTVRHPAPLPQPPVNQINRPNLKLLPPRPALKISKVQSGIVLSWNMSLGPEHAPISSYQLYAYQESNSPPATSLWKKVGDVKALPLPMACTLTQFMSGHKYHFAVRAVDLHSRIGPFSFPGTIVLGK